MLVPAWGVKAIIFKSIQSSAASGFDCQNRTGSYDASARSGWALRTGYLKTEHCNKTEKRQTSPANQIFNCSLNDILMDHKTYVIFVCQNMLYLQLQFLSKHVQKTRGSRSVIEKSRETESGIREAGRWEEQSVLGEEHRLGRHGNRCASATTFNKSHGLNVSEGLSCFHQRDVKTEAGSGLPDLRLALSVVSGQHRGNWLTLLEQRGW